MDTLEHYFTTCDSIKIHYLTAWKEGSRAVLIHGYTGSPEGNWFPPDRDRTRVYPACQCP